MVRVSSPAKLRPWSELTAKMVMGVVPGLVNLGCGDEISSRTWHSAEEPRERAARLQSEIVRVAVLQNKVCTKDFVRGTNYLTKNAPKFSPKVLSLYFVGQKNSPQNSFQISRKISLPKMKKKSPTSFCRGTGRRNCARKCLNSKGSMARKTRKRIRTTIWKVSENVKTSLRL